MPGKNYRECEFVPQIAHPLACPLAPYVARYQLILPICLQSSLVECTVQLVWCHPFVAPFFLLTMSLHNQFISLKYYHDCDKLGLMRHLLASARLMAYT